jgi:predicted ABC-type ATPase
VRRPIVIQLVHVTREPRGARRGRLRARPGASRPSGGHDIPEEKIHQRYDHSRINLIELMATPDRVLPFCGVIPSLKAAIIRKHPV